MYNYCGLASTVRGGMSRSCKHLNFLFSVNLCLKDGIPLL